MGLPLANPTTYQSHDNRFDYLENLKPKSPRGSSLRHFALCALHESKKHKKSGNARLHDKASSLLDHILRDLKDCLEKESEYCSIQTDRFDLLEHNFGLEGIKWLHVERYAVIYFDFLDAETKAIVKRGVDEQKHLDKWYMLFWQRKGEQQKMDQRPECGDLGLDHALQRIDELCWLLSCDLSEQRERGSTLDTYIFGPKDRRKFLKSESLDEHLRLEGMVHKDLLLIDTRLPQCVQYLVPAFKRAIERALKNVTGEEEKEDSEDVIFLEDEDNSYSTRSSEIEQLLLSSDLPADEDDEMIFEIWARINQDIVNDVRPYSMYRNNGEGSVVADRARGPVVVREREVTVEEQGTMSGRTQYQAQALDPDGEVIGGGVTLMGSDAGRSIGEFRNGVYIP